MNAGRIVLVVALVGRGSVACSSDGRPAPASGEVPSSSGAIPTYDASRLPDADDAGDAAPSTADGGCLGDAPSLGGGVPTCPDSGACATYCNDIVAHYKLGLAQQAVACLLKLPSCASALDVNLCIDDALDRACKDPATTAYCGALVTACDPNPGGPGSLIDRPSCEKLASGLSPAGRDTFASCVQGAIDAGTCVSDVRLCTDAIRQ